MPEMGTWEARRRRCDLDPESPRVLGGHPMLAAAALQALKQSTLKWGDFPDAKATVYYKFGDYDRPRCENAYSRVEGTGSRVRVLAVMPCIQR